MSSPQEIRTNRTAQTADPSSSGAGIVVSGTVLARADLTMTGLILQYPGPITSSAASPGVPPVDPVRIEGATGLFAAASIATIDFSAGAIEIRLPECKGACAASLLPGSFRLVGVRIDANGLSSPAFVVPSLKNTANNYILGTGLVPIIGAFGPGIGEMSIGTRSPELTNQGAATIFTGATSEDSKASVAISEGFASAWRTSAQAATSSSGTTPNGYQIRFTVSGLSAGQSVFVAGNTPPGLSFSMSGTTFTQAFPSQTIEFTATNLFVKESFQLDFTFTGLGNAPLIPGAITLTATMGPVGTATNAAGAPTAANGYPVFAPETAGPVTIANIVAAGSQVPTISPLSANPPGLSQAVAPLGGRDFMLTVAGQNFLNGAVVSAGSTSLSTTFVDTALLTAVVPSGTLTAAGTIPIRVTNPGGLQSNIVDLNVVATGDLSGNGKVNIADALVAARSAGGLMAPRIPPSVGDVNLSGTTDIGDALVLALVSGGAVSNVNTPAVTSLFPPVAVRGGVLRINGIGFSPVAADNQVWFRTATGGLRIAPAASTSASLTVTVPANAVSGPGQVYRLDMPLGGAEFPVPVDGTASPLVLTGISPYFNAASGAVLKLTGMGFDALPASNSVFFKSATGTVAGTVTDAKSSSLTVIAPAGAVCGPVTVSANGQTSNARMLVPAGTSCPLQLTGMWGGGSAGDVLVLEGSGFDVVAPSANVVRFPAAGGGTVPATVIMAGRTQLHVRIPFGIAAGNITVTVGSVTSNAVAFSPAS